MCRYTCICRGTTMRFSQEWFVNLLIIKTLSKMKTTKKTTNESKKCPSTVNDETTAENFQGAKIEDEISDVEFENVEDDTIVFPDCVLYDDSPL